MAVPQGDDVLQADAAIIRAAIQSAPAGGQARGASVTGPGKHSDHSYNCLIGKTIWANTTL
jgi:lipopolysaccharide export system protein LptA